MIIKYDKIPFRFDLVLLTFVLKIVLMILNAKMMKSVIMGHVSNVPMIINVEKGKDATKIHVCSHVKRKMTVN